MEVPYFAYDRMFEADGVENVFKRVASKGQFIMQADLALFEEEVARFLELPAFARVFGVADGTIAIQLGLHLAGVGVGDEVLVPTHTFVATAAAVVHAGAVPVLVDIGDDLLMCPKDAESKITSKTKAILPVQLNGFVCNMDSICELARRYNLAIVEDSAQAFGAKWCGRFAGTFGVAGTASFYPAKTLGCYGDGGSIFVNDSDMIEQAELLRNHGRRAKDAKPVLWGYNCRLDNVQAAILREKLLSYPQAISRRREIAKAYDFAFKSLDGVITPGKYLDPRVSPIYQNYEIVVDEMLSLKEWLATNGIGTLRQWNGVMLHQCDGLKILGSDSCPNAERLSNKNLMLPLNHYMFDDEVEYVIDRVKAFYEK